MPPPCVRSHTSVSGALQMLVSNIRQQPVVEVDTLIRATVEIEMMTVVRGSSSPASMGIGILDEDARILASTQERVV